MKLLIFVKFWSLSSAFTSQTFYRQSRWCYQCICAWLMFLCDLSFIINFDPELFDDHELGTICSFFHLIFDLGRLTSGLWNLKFLVAYRCSCFEYVNINWVSYPDGPVWRTQIYDYDYVWLDFRLLVSWTASPHPTVHVVQLNMSIGQIIWRVPGFEKFPCTPRNSLIPNFNVIQIELVSSLILADGYIRASGSCIRIDNLCSCMGVALFSRFDRYGICRSPNARLFLTFSVPVLLLL